jgi:hypothetical protein
VEPAKDAVVWISDDSPAEAEEEGIEQLRENGSGMRV